MSNYHKHAKSMLEECMQASFEHEGYDYCLFALLDRTGCLACGPNEKRYKVRNAQLGIHLELFLCTTMTAPGNSQTAECTVQVQ